MFSSIARPCIVFATIVADPDVTLWGHCPERCCGKHLLFEISSVLCLGICALVGLVCGQWSGYDMWSICRGVSAVLLSLSVTRCSLDWSFVVAAAFLPVMLFIQVQYVSVETAFMPVVAVFRASFVAFETAVTAVLVSPQTLFDAFVAVLIPFLDALNVTLEAFVATAIPLSDTSLAKLAAFVKDEAVIRAFFVTCVVTLPAICGIISHTAFVNLVICHVLLVFAAGSLVTILSIPRIVSMCYIQLVYFPGPASPFRYNTSPGFDGFWHPCGRFSIFPEATVCTESLSSCCCQSKRR